MEFKERIKQLREEKELTHSQLAAMYGKSEGAIRSWETGRSNPDVDTVIKLASYFDCTTDYLLGLSGIRNQEEKDNLSLAMAETDSMYSNLKEEYKIGFQETIAPFLFSFYLLNEDEENRGKEPFFDYVFFLRYIGAFFNTQFGVFSEPYFDKPKDEYDKKRMMITAAFDLKIALEETVFHVLGLKNTNDMKAQFEIDYNAYKKYWGEYIDEVDKKKSRDKKDGENNATQE